MLAQSQNVFGSKELCNACSDDPVVPFSMIKWFWRFLVKMAAIASYTSSKMWNLNLVIDTEYLNDTT